MLWHALPRADRLRRDIPHRGPLMAPRRRDQHCGGSKDGLSCLDIRLLSVAVRATHDAVGPVYRTVSAGA